ncbi:MAG: DUF2254 domain-containing protein [Pseudomonadaceae bacterium]|nr:DUF2254 domain-containing protein [Pseudomonadaceae bacterium]
MHAKIVDLIRRFRGSYWFIPSLMVGSACLLALFCAWLDAEYFDDKTLNVAWLYQGDAAGARAVLAAIATSMIGVAGVTFSMTIVTVSFAASNIGPRLIDNFMRDRGNQVTLGTFIATFAYCLLVLRSVTDPSQAGEAAHVPHFSLLVAMLLTALSVINLIYFIHHIPESINVGNLAHKLAHDLQVQIEREFPPDADTKEQAAVDLPGDQQRYDSMRLNGYAVRTKTAGYIQVLDVQELVAEAASKDVTLLLACRPGGFVNQTDVLLYVWPGKELSEKEERQLADKIVVGEKRTSDQDFLFLVDQLIEIILRALSPGTNDAFTAVSCLDWIQSTLLLVMSRRPELAERFDDEKKLRLVIPTVTFEELTDAFFLQPLQYVAGNRVAAVRMMEVFAALLSASRNATQTEIILKHVERLNNAAREQLPVKSDQEDLQSLYVSTLARVANPVI